MLTILREFLTRSDDGKVVKLCECLVQNDSTWMHNIKVRTQHEERYFREADGFQHAKRAKEIAPEVYELEGGLILREFDSE